ncbi:MAG: hypothetical protein V4670_10905 [Bacteroidota bacterium]
MEKLEKRAKMGLLASTLALAIFSVLVINAFIFIIYTMEIINSPDFDIILLSFKDDYYTINGEKRGISIFLNLIGILSLWFLMTYHTLRSIHKSLSYIF